MRKEELIRALAKSAEPKSNVEGKLKKGVAKPIAAKLSAPPAKSPSVKTAVTKSANSKTATPKTAAPKATSAKVAKSKVIEKPAGKPAEKSKITAKKIAPAQPVKVKEKKEVAPPKKPAPPVAKIKAKPVEVVKPTSAKVIRKIQQAHELRGLMRDLAAEVGRGNAGEKKDRIILIVRDPYWLQAYWEVRKETVERARVALAEHWHTAKPILRLTEIDDDHTTNTSERVVRDIPVHGGVRNWYIDVDHPPRTFRVSLCYKTAGGKIYLVSRSNKVMTPEPGNGDIFDENWTDIGDNCEKIFAMSGGYNPDNADTELKDVFEDRLRRPMGSPVATQYGAGADVGLGKSRDFQFSVDAEMVVYGETQPSAYVTLAGEPIKLREDGSFSIRMALPDRRQVLPIVASSADGVEQRTTVIAIERNTKVMEPLIKESSED